MNDIAIKEAIEAVEALRKKITSLEDDALDLLFREARTHNGWSDKPVTDEQIQLLYQLTISGPTTANSQPSRFIFCRTPEAKERLLPCLAPGNVEKTRAAPVTVIIGYDSAFWEHLPRMFPHKDMTGMYRNNASFVEVNGLRNSSLQGAYLIVAARAMGLDIGAMSGFNHDAIDEEFFSGTTIKSNFLCNIGYGDTKALYNKLPRFDFDEICEVI
ncbi:MAG: malonic semialdehyde reductase [Rhodospirillaceae bacterium]|jgi:3-hydroxypropanoate dehydrogenase